MAISDLRVGPKGVGWVQLAQDVCQNRAVSTVMTLWVSYKAGNFLTDERVLGLLRSTPLRGFCNNDTGRILRTVYSVLGLFCCTVSFL